MPVPPPMLSILADSDEPRSIQSLAKRSNGNYRAFVKAAHNLEDRGAIELQAHGRESLVVPASSQLTGLASDLLTTRAHPGLVDVFRADRPTMMRVLHKTRRIDSTAAIMAKSPGAVRYMIRALKRTGLLVKEPTGYQIHPAHRSLVELLGELDRLWTQHRVEQEAPKGRLVWHLGPEFLVQTDQAIDGSQTAGLDAFSEYGIDIRTTGAPLRYVGKRALTAADAIVQALVAIGYETPNPDMTPKGSVRVGPEFNYAFLPWEKEAPRDIWEKSEIYFGKESPARDVVEYVQEKSEWAGFIPWSEHERLRKLYGIGT